MDFSVTNTFLRFVATIVFVFVQWNYGFSQNRVVYPSEIISPIAFDVSLPLRAMPVIAPEINPEKNQREVPNRSFSMVYRELYGPLEKIGKPDPVLQEIAGALPPVSTIVNMDGLNNISGVIPPDPTGDVGKDHYIQAINLSFAVYLKTGELLYGPASLGSLWQGFPGAYTNDGDPVVLYDHLADRWVITQFSLPNYPNGPFYELLAVSQTSDPLGAWYRYSFQFSNMPDYPKLGVWYDGYYMSANMYLSGSGNWAGPAAIALERDSLLVGKNARMEIFQLVQTDLPMLVADLDGPAPPDGTPGLFLSATDELTGSTDHLNLFTLKPNWYNPASAVLQGPQVINTAEFDANMCNGTFSCIPQAGTNRRLDPLTRYLMQRLQYRNFGTYQVMMTNHTVDADGTDHAGIRWYELRTTDTIWSVFQQGTYAPDTNHRWLGSIAMDRNGNVALAYSVSGDGLFPSIRATGRRACDSTGYMSLMEESIMEGTGAQKDASSRWGDYSCLSLDPVNDETFWYTNEYYATISNQDWITRIASFTIDNLPVGISDKQSTVSASFHNLQNYPNPFAKTTVITWQLKVRSHCVVNVYDLTGKVVVLLVNQELPAGNHETTFDASALVQGVYYYQLRAEGSVETRKMVVCN